MKKGFLHIMFRSPLDECRTFNYALDDQSWKEELINSRIQEELLHRAVHTGTTGGRISR